MTGGKFTFCVRLVNMINFRYERRASQRIPTIAGYATAYPYHFYTKSSTTNDTNFYNQVFRSDASTSFINCRLRLSQFIILPPFQHVGHGGKFYDAIVNNARADPQVQEISIEDPSAAFEDLRDRRDLRFLEQQQVFKGIKAPVPKQWVEETRKQFKMPSVHPLMTWLIWLETVSKSIGNVFIKKH